LIGEVLAQPSRALEHSSTAGDKLEALAFPAYQHVYEEQILINIIIKIPRFFRTAIQRKQ
jgi:hypothetical protein